MKKNSTTVILVESALMIALSVVLDFFKLWQMPFGGSVTCGMVPLVLLSFHRGPKWGVGAAFTHSSVSYTHLDRLCTEASGFLFGGIEGKDSGL